MGIKYFKIYEKSTTILGRAVCVFIILFTFK